VKALSNFIKKHPVWLGMLAFIFFLLVIKYYAAHKQGSTWAEKMASRILVPFQKAVLLVDNKIESYSYLFRSKNKLQEDIAEYQKQLSELKIENQRLKEYEAEAKRLQALLNFKELNGSNFDLLGARIIARSPSNWYKIVTIDRGTADGVQKDMPVISPDGLVGCIASADLNTSQVYLITDREIAVGVILQETRDTKGIVEGTGENDLLTMVNIPYYSGIEAGQTVITSGLSEIYPKGIKIGTIEKISREESGLLLTASVKPAVNFDRLEEVFVIRGY